MPIPATVEEIRSKNLDELITVEFFPQDFFISAHIAPFLWELKKFKKVRFFLSDDDGIKDNINTRANFIDFCGSFLCIAEALEFFDVSNNDFSANTFNMALARVEKGIRSEAKKQEAYANTLSYRLNSFLGCFLHQMIFFPDMTIDLRNLLKGSHFTLKQLYQVIQPDEEEGFPKAKILVSVQELPKCLKDQFIDNKDEAVDLSSISQTICTKYRETLFNRNISRIEQSFASDNPVAVAFSPSFGRFTEEETQKLIDALHQENCKVAYLSLPLCDVDILIPEVLKLSTLTHLNLSELTCQEFAHLGVNGIGIDKVVDHLEEVVKSDSIERISCDWLLFLSDNFQRVIRGILNNPNSNLKKNRDGAYRYRYIELTNKSGETNSATVLLALIKKIQEYQPEDLENIQIVIDSSMISPDLWGYLTAQKLFHCFINLSSRGDPFNYTPREYDLSLEDFDRRSQPFLVGITKVILSPTYCTHKLVMAEIRAYLEKKMAMTQSNSVKKSEKVDFTLSETDTSRKKNIPLGLQDANFAPQQVRGEFASVPTPAEGSPLPVEAPPLSSPIIHQNTDKETPADATVPVTMNNVEELGKPTDSTLIPNIKTSAIPDEKQEEVLSFQGTPSLSNIPPKPENTEVYVGPDSEVSFLEPKRYTSELEQLINENNLFALQAFLPFFKSAQTTENSDDPSDINREEKPDVLKLAVQADNVSQLPWLQPVIAMLAILDRYINLPIYTLKSERYISKSDICPILIHLNAVLECLNRLQNDNATVLEIPKNFDRLDTAIRNIEQELTGINDASILKLKAAQYGLYIVAMLAVIASIIFGLFLALPYIAIPIGIAVLALAVSEVLRQHQNNFDEEAKTNTENLSNIPKKLSDTLSADFKPATLQNVRTALTFFCAKEDSGLENSSSIQSVRLFLGKS